MRTFWLLLAAAGLAFAQLDTDTITITARAPAQSLQPDQAQITVRVTADLTIGLDGVLQALQGTGISDRDVVSVYQQPFGVCVPGDGCQSASVVWTFQITTPLSKLKEAMAALTPATVAHKTGIQVSHSITGAVSAALLAAQECAYPALIAAARRQAESIAAAAGVRVGNVVALSDGSGNDAVPTAVFVYDPLTAVRLSAFLLSSPAPAPAPACSAVVQFKLLQ